VILRRNVEATLGKIVSLRIADRDETAIAGCGLDERQHTAGRGDTDTVGFIY
jgi:hypothetical protein